MTKKPYIFETLICCILCSITLFIFSHRFVNEEITPKWLGLMLCIGFACIALTVQNRKLSLPAKPIVIILMCSFLFVFVENWVIFDFDLSLLMYLSGLLLLFFLLQQTVSFCPPQYLFGTVAVFALALSLHGVFQYLGVLSSGNSNFAVTGNFDNPAGFSAALVCVFLLCFYFFKNKTKYFKYITITTVVIMAIAIFLSGSRAGILAVTVVTAVWFLIKSKIANQKLKIAVAVAVIVLPVFLYFFKKDSADGRLLIWRCTLDMIADKPILGHGQGAFQAKYMLYQAEYFNANPDSQYALLADNVLHPFNEYLLILSEYGLAGLGIFIFVVLLLVRAYQHNRSDEKLPALMSLLALSVFSFFSYPFKYPFTWVILFLCIAVICNPVTSDGQIPIKKSKNKNWIYRINIFLLSTGLITYSIMLTQAEIKWKSITHLSMAGHTVQMLPKYDQLYQWIGNKSFFLYNHAAELHVAGEYEKSIAVFANCTHYYNDIDVQMLLAYNYKELKKYREAEQHLKLAAAMCPVKFMPLYELVKLYEATDCKDEALALAKKIIDKEVKVPSPTVTAIKNEMRRIIEAQKTSTNEPASVDHTDKPSGNDETRQGEMPKVQPNGGALPP